MNIAKKYSVPILMSLAFANWSLCFQGPCRAAEQTPVNQTERIQVLATEDRGLPPIDRARAFSSSILEQATSAGLTLTATSKITSRTNGPFIELRQNLAVEAAESQLLDFLGNIAGSNSTLRIRSLALHPSPDRSRLRANLAITADYRLSATGQFQEPPAAQNEHAVLSQRRQLRRAALDCYNLTKSTLPAGWQFDSFSFEDGKRLSVVGTAPADQVRLLQDVRAKLEKGRAQDGKALLVPSAGEATMRMTPGSTNFSWSMHFDLAQGEPR